MEVFKKTMTLEGIQKELKIIHPELSIVYDEDMEEPDSYATYDFLNGNRIVAEIDRGKNTVTWNEENMAKKLMLERRISAAESLLSVVAPLAKTYKSASAETPN